MSDNVFDESDKPIIVGHIKNWVKTNGYVSTRYACLDAVKKLDGTNKDWDSIDYDGHREAFINSVSSILVNTGEYVRERNRLGYDYDILLNPAFFLNKSVTKTSKTTMKLAGLAVVISLISLFKDFFVNEEIKVKELQQTTIQLQNTSQNLNSIRKALESINSSLQKTKPDTVYMKQK